MWSPCGKAVALLVAGLILVEPPLLAAGGFEGGQGTAQRLLERFGTPDAIRGGTRAVPNYSPENFDRATSNPYYTEDPETSGRRARVGQDAGTLAESSPAGQIIGNRALSPWTWTFGSASQLVTGLERQLPSGASQEPGCRAVAYCAEPVMGGTEETCEATQTSEQVSCSETYAIVPAPDGGEQVVFTDTCEPYRPPPWFPSGSVCRDPPEQTRCVSHLTIERGSEARCVDDTLFMRIVQDGQTLRFQVLDTGPGGEPHRNCDDGGGDFEGWHTLKAVPLAQAPGPPSFTLSAQGEGCATNSVTITGVGSQAVVTQCGEYGPQSPTLSWEIPIGVTACHECWDLERTFGKVTVLSSTCEPLIARGCTPTGQECLTPDCTQARKLYRCQGEGGCARWDDTLLCTQCIPNPPGEPICLDTQHPANGDFALAAAAMEGAVTLSFGVFPGEREGCARKLFGLVDCCSGGQEQAQQIRTAVSALQTALQAYRLGEVAVNAAQLIATGAPVFSAMAQAAQASFMQALTPLLGLSWSTVFLLLNVTLMFIQWFLLNCSEADARAAIKRNLNTCRTVGDYCSQRVLFACVEETTTSCCFSTLLARIIQERGRAQLGIGWGDGENPECRGLTVEELQRIDFSRIDLTEYIRDLQDRMRWPTAEELLHRQGQVTGTDYRGRAEETTGQAGTLGPRIRGAIAPPGGW